VDTSKEAMPLITGNGLLADIVWVWRGDNGLYRESKKIQELTSPKRDKKTISDHNSRQRVFFSERIVERDCGGKMWCDTI
jgi:hypothetical protein